MESNLLKELDDFSRLFFGTVFLVAFIGSAIAGVFYNSRQAIRKRGKQD